MRPEELLPRNLTLSIGSRVPPAVTSTLSPSSPVVLARAGEGSAEPSAPGSPAPASACSQAASRRAGSARRPTPSSPLEASRPTPGSTTVAPRSRSVLRLACVAGCSYMRLFIAGAITSGQRAASAQLRQQVVGEAGGELGDRVGRGGRDQIHVGVGDQLQVAERLVRRRRLVGEGAARGVALELADEHRRAGERRERRLADEAPAGGRLHDAHRVPGRGRQAHELERLVRGDAAADAEQDPRHDYRL